MRGNEVYNELAGVSLSPSMREVQIAVMLRMAMSLRVSKGKFALECTFKHQDSAVWLKNAIEEAFSILSELRSVPDEKNSNVCVVSFRGNDAKRLLLFSKLLDVKTKRIVASFPPFIDLSSIPVAKTVWRGAIMARGEVVPEKKSGIKIGCSSVDLANKLQEAASTLGVEAQANCRGRKKSVEVPPAAQTVKMLNLIGAGECAKKIRSSLERTSEVEAKHVVTQLYEANRQRSSAAAKKACEKIKNAFEILEGREINPDLRQAGELRLAHPNATLSELGKLAKPPISKDAVAGRMRRLYRLALDVKEGGKAARPK